MRNVRSDSLANRVLEIIKECPGNNAINIAEQLQVESKAVKGAIAFHRREGRIINRGKAARGARWYPNYEHPEMNNNESEPMPAQDWRKALRSPTPTRGSCKKCGGKPTVARVMLMAQEKEDGAQPSGGQKFSNLTSKTAMLCGNCIADVYKKVESAMAHELGESD